jgi:hypothetical protein
MHYSTYTRIESLAGGVFSSDRAFIRALRSKLLKRAVGRGESRKSFCPWFVNRGAWCAAKGSRFFG